MCSRGFYFAAFWLLVLSATAIRPADSGRGAAENRPEEPNERVAEAATVAARMAVVFADR